MKPDRFGHRKRGSDATSFDFTCITCSASDRVWNDGLHIECLNQLPPKA